MASSLRPSLKGQRSVSPSEDDIASSSVVLGTPSQRTAVRDFEEGLRSGPLSDCVAALKSDFESLTWPGSPLEWLKEPLAMGFTPEEVVDVLLNEKKYSPWIPYEIPRRTTPQMNPHFHQASCVHLSVHNESKSMKSLSTEAKRMIAEYCGFGGILPHESLDPECIGHVRFEDSTAYISYRDLDELDDTYVILNALKRCRLALKRITRLCAWLQENGWVCNQIVVIRYNDTVRSAAIPFSLMNQLRECVDETMTRPLQNQDRRNYRMFETALELLDMAAPASLSTGYQLDNAVDICALAVQMISISFLSLCKAHVGPIHPFFLDRPMTKICLSGIDGPLSREHEFEFQLRGLACLGLMLGDSIMVFGSNRGPVVQEDRRGILKTYVEHLLELWGPARLEPGSGEFLEAIRIGGGVIYQPFDRSVLHWAPGSLDVSSDEVSHGVFDKFGLLSIAGLLSINQSCPSRLQHELVPISVIRQEIHVLGTKNENWNLQQIQVGLQLGQIANANINTTWLKSASRTRKELVVADIGLDVLDQPWGLLVSLCTGIARRVPLREVVAEVFPQIVLAWLDDPDRSRGFLINDVCAQMRQSSFRKWLSSEPYHVRVASKHIRRVLRKLCWTGVNLKSKLITACTSDEQADGCIRIPLDNSPILATILKDTERSATFASLSTECVVTDQHKCQSTPLPEWRNKVTALATSVCQYRYVGGGDWEKVPNNGLEHGRLYWMGHLNDHRRLVAEVSGAQGNEVTLKVADSQVLWAFYLRAYEKVERMRAHYIALREQSYIGEEGSQEVLVVNG
ncbi:hypothetical protein KCU67_g1213, partial [Aureobasidium melanogenum]